MNAKQLHDNGRKSPVRRYAATASVVLSVATAASLFWLRGCNKPAPETIIIAPAVKTPCGCFGADTTSRDSTGTRHVFISRKQGCDSSHANYDSSCGCPEKTPAPKLPKPKKQAAVALKTTIPCASTPSGPLASGIKVTIADGLAAKASELRNVLVSGDQSRKIYVAVSLELSGGTISAQKLTPECDGGCTPTKVTIANTTGINVVGRQVEAVGEGRCMWKYREPLK